MNEPTRLQLDPLEQVKTILEDAPRSYRFLSEYVKAVAWHHNEEDIFTDYASENAPHGDPPFVTSVFSELYETLDAEHKLEVRRWWHEMVRAQVNQFTDLKARLSRLT